MDYKEEQNGEIEALLSIYEGEIEGKKHAGKNMPVGRERVTSVLCQGCIIYIYIRTNQCQII